MMGGQSGSARPPHCRQLRVIAAILVLGGIGFAVGRWVGTSPSLLRVGLATGILFGFACLLRRVRQP